MALSHNKRNNVGLTHRLLMREATAGMVEGDARRAKKAIRMISRYFGPQSSLMDELAAYDNVLGARGLNRVLAESVLDETVKVAAKTKRDERIWQALREDVTKVYGPSFWDTRLPEYRELASVSILVESARRGVRVQDAGDRARVRNALIERMVAPDVQKPVANPDLDALTYSRAVAIFEQRYSSMDDAQKKLMKAYVGSLFGEPPSKFRTVFEESAREIGRSISSCLREQTISSDKVLSERLNEALKELKTMRPVADDETVGRLMMFHTLRKEISSNE
jgi:hypothetical protein